jgi:hypothetical protein
LISPVSHPPLLAVIPVGLRWSTMRPHDTASRRQPSVNSTAPSCRLCVLLLHNIWPPSIVVFSYEE